MTNLEQSEQLEMTILLVFWGGSTFQTQSIGSQMNPNKLISVLEVQPHPPTPGNKQQTKAQV